MRSPKCLGETYSEVRVIIQNVSLVLLAALFGCTESILMNGNLKKKNSLLVLSEEIILKWKQSTKAEHWARNWERKAMKDAFICKGLGGKIGWNFEWLESK